MIKVFYTILLFFFVTQNAVAAQTCTAFLSLSKNNTPEISLSPADYKETLSILKRSRNQSLATSIAPGPLKQSRFAAQIDKEKGLVTLSKSISERERVELYAAHLPTGDLMPVKITKPKKVDSVEQKTFDLPNATAVIALNDGSFLVGDKEGQLTVLSLSKGELLQANFGALVLHPAPARSAVGNIVDLAKDAFTKKNNEENIPDTAILSIAMRDDERVFVLTAAGDVRSIMVFE